jgi:hypothetical protein
VAVPVQAVFTRAAWADDWTAQPNLHCQRVTRATGETLSAAEFRWRFGGYLAPGATAWATQPVVAILPLSYVRVLTTGAGGRSGFQWLGLWRAAVKNDVDQIFSAVGIEHALDEPCLDSPWWDGAAVQWAGVGLEANANTKPNRSVDRHTVNGQSVYVWEPDEAVAQYWTTRTIVETLLALGAPKNAAGTVLWNWTPVDLTQLPDFDLPRVPTHSVTYLTLLRSLVTRYRLTGFVVEPPLTGDDLNVRFFSFAEAAINLTDSTGLNVVGTIPANLSQDYLVYSADQSATSSFSIEGSNVADQVVVIGARRKKVFSLFAADDAWTRLWSEDLETEYTKGASEAADYPPEEDQDLRDQRDQDARNTERLRPVYSHFGPAADWDQTVTDEEMPPNLYPIGTDLAGNQVVLYAPLLEFSERLPLLSGYEYDGSKIADLEGEFGHHGTWIPGVPHEELPPLVFVRVVHAYVDPERKDRWQLLDQLGRNADLEQLADRSARTWSGEARTLRGQLGLEIRVHGAPQHVLAVHETLFTPLALTGTIDWGNIDQDLIATVAIEDPRPIEVRYPADADLAAYGELIRRIRVEAPDLQLVYVVPDTVVGVNPQTLELLTTDGGYVIDDRTEMGLIAQRTYEWHRVPRYALRLATGWVDGSLRVGHLIRQATDPSGTFAVNSVISEITVEFPIATGGTPPRPTLSLVTAFGEFDARRA